MHSRIGLLGSGSDGDAIFLHCSCECTDEPCAYVCLQSIQGRFPTSQKLSLSCGFSATASVSRKVSFSNLHPLNTLTQQGVDNSELCRNTLWFQDPSRPGGPTPGGICSDGQILIFLEHPFPNRPTFTHLQQTLWPRTEFAEKTFLGAWVMGEPAARVPGPGSALCSLKAMTGFHKLFLRNGNSSQLRVCSRRDPGSVVFDWVTSTIERVPGSLRGSLYEESTRGFTICNAGKLCLFYRTAFTLEAPEVPMLGSHCSRCARRLCVSQSDLRRTVPMAAAQRRCARGVRYEPTRRTCR